LGIKGWSKVTILPIEVKPAPKKKATGAKKEPDTSVNLKGVIAEYRSQELDYNRLQEAASRDP
jgi:hypothetical protein